LPLPGPSPGLTTSSRLHGTGNHTGAPGKRQFKRPIGLRLMWVVADSRYPDGTRK
jgi:hypothetical protein